MNAQIQNLPNIVNQLYALQSIAILSRFVIADALELLSNLLFRDELGGD